jgi:hypothetical protein
MLLEEGDRAIMPVGFDVVSICMSNFKSAKLYTYTFVSKATTILCQKGGQHPTRCNYFVSADEPISSKLHTLNVASELQLRDRFCLMVIENYNLTPEAKLAQREGEIKARRANSEMSICPASMTSSCLSYLVLWILGVFAPSNQRQNIAAKEHFHDPNSAIVKIFYRTKIG